MNLTRIYTRIFLALLTIVIFAQCGQKPIEHGTEYLLRVADGTDTAETRKAYLIIENRLKNFGLDGDYEISMENSDIRVRIREGAQYDKQRLRKLLESSAGLTFRATYGINEIGDEINEAQATFLRLNNIDSSHAMGAGLAAYLLPGEYNEGASPLIGYCLPKDTASVNAILRHDSIASLFPFDLVFHWGKGIPDANGFETLSLVACKTGRNHELSGSHVATSESQYNEQSGSASPQIAITFDQSGSDEWARLTKASIGKSIAIELDNFVYSFPAVQSEITGGQAVITGNFTESEAHDLAMLLNSGQLPANFRIVEEKTF